MAILFDKLDTPDFDGLTADEAWKACEDWEDWAYREADSFSEEMWDRIVVAIRNNYSRYYIKYES
jgi:hypothetical protein